MNIEANCLINLLVSVQIALITYCKKYSNTQEIVMLIVSYNLSCIYKSLKLMTS